MHTHKRITIIGAAVFCLLLTACGGGSNSPLDAYNNSTSSANSSTINTTSPSKIGFGSGADFKEGIIGSTKAALLAGGSETLTINIVSGTNTLVTAPVNVTFNSNCFANSEATFSTGGAGGSTEVLTPTVATANGQASIVYKAKGCKGKDLITASTTLNGEVKTAQVTIDIAADTVLSVKFIKAEPESIGLQGASGAETSLVQFQVLGATGAPIKDINVDFTLSTKAGGLSLTQSSGITDKNGFVSTTVQAGAIPTSVTVEAKDPASGIFGRSNKLIIATGLPDQNSTSISASVFNPSGWNRDGELSNITIRLADDFNNPAPDGTAVYFTAEGGSVRASCTTDEGTCTVPWRSQDFRPSDGRVTILATTQGNESFIDRDGDGMYTKGKDIFSTTSTGGDCKPNDPRSSEFPEDPIDNPTPCDDLTEAYVDSNENGVHDEGEKFVDYNNDSKYSTENGIYNGVRCKTDGEGCTKEGVSIRESLVLVMSSDHPFSVDGLLPGQPEKISVGAGEIKTFTVVLADIHGNAMPAGTTIALVTNSSNDVTINHNMPASGVPSTTLPTKFTVTMKGSDSKPASGSFGIAVKAPYLETVFTTSFGTPTPVVSIAKYLGAGVSTAFVPGAIESSIGNKALASGGSTNLSVYLLDDAYALSNSAVPVKFSSACIASGKAKLTLNNTVTDTVTSANGKATITYTAIGCVGTDVVTATPQTSLVLAPTTASTTLTVDNAAAQSIAFESAEPTQISLKGTGGKETSLVKFKVTGAEGAAISGANVTLALNSSLGGLCLISGTDCLTSVPAVSDANGIVSATVLAGSIPTSVRVTATTGNISTQSSKLVVSTGIPDQNSMSLSASTFNPGGWNTDGVEVSLTIRMADAFNNPPPDGTTVTFTTEGGSIGSTCNTESGACSVKWKSQAPRPKDGRVRIRATALGNESFIDTNGNGYYDKEAYTDTNNNGKYDLGETFVDKDSNGKYTADIFNTNVEPFTDVNGDGIYTAAADAEPFVDANNNGTWNNGETFTDSNNNGVYDKNYIDVDGNSKYSKGESCQANTPVSTASSNDPFDAPCDDLVEAYLDTNDNGVHDDAEEIVDYDGNRIHTPQNGKYNGVLCGEEGPNCTKTGVDVRDDIFIVMSSQYPSTSSGTLIGQPANVQILATQAVSFVVTLQDINGNSMPAGTKVSINSGGSADVTVTHTLPASGVPNSPYPTAFTVKLLGGTGTPTGSFDIVVEAPGMTTSFTTTLN